MCIRIVGKNTELEFDSSKPLEGQLGGAKQVLVNYDPTDGKIDLFIYEMERMVQNGVGCDAEFKVNINNNVNGIRLERRLEKLKKDLEMNQIIKSMVIFHANTDKKLDEMSEICSGKQDEH